MLMIDGAAMPSPSALSLSWEDISSRAERSAAGSAVRDFRGGKRRLKLRWAHLESAALRTLLTAVQDRFFTVAFPDPRTGAQASAECWCESCSAGVLRVKDGAPVWTNIEMEWMER